MSKTEEDESAVSKSGARPDRLGLGAKVTRHSNIGPLNDPIDRKLHNKLNAGKRKFSNADEVSIPSKVVGRDDDDDEEEEELESRTRAFAKKQAVPLAISMEAKKKQK